MLLETTDIGGDLVAVAFHGLGMAGRHSMVAFGQRRLGDQRTQAGLVRLVLEMGELLVGHCEVATKVPKLRTDIGQSAFQRGPRHGGEV